jgi:hypothetical protein
MNYRDTSNETSALWSVDAIEDMAFLQAANKEAFAHGVLAQIGNSYNQANMYVLWGCVNSGVYPAYSISAGAVYYRSAAAIVANLPGEIYTVDAVAFTVTTPHVAVAKVTEVSDGDMRLFSDGNTRAVTIVKKVVLSEGASGTGDVDFAKFVPLVVRWQGYLASTGLVSRTGSTVTTNVAHYTTPNDGATRNYRITFKLQYQCGISGSHGVFVGANITTGSSTGTVIGASSFFQVPLINGNFSLPVVDAFCSDGYCIYEGTIAPNTSVYFNSYITVNGNDATFNDLLAIVEQIV